MSQHAAPELIRSTILHTPRNPFRESGALECFTDGGLLLTGGAIQAAGDYADVRGAHPEAPVHDLRGCVVLPGFIDTHVHFPQLRIIGALGCGLLDWLNRFALPEEVRMGEPDYARAVAGEFVDALASHGTTTALVFGSHFHDATAMLFEAASAKGMRITSGLVLSDRLLPEPLRSTADCAYQQSRALIERFHGHDGLRYAVTPRFALSASEAMLEICQALLRDHPDVGLQTHLNENTQEIVNVLRAFPHTPDYLSVYDRFGLVGPRSVFAHNVHPTEGELERLAGAGSAVAHCPCSNASLGSGFFPMGRHLAAGVRIALGSDVGAGTGFGMVKEALQCYLLQRVMPEGVALTPAHLLYLATRAGAEAMGLEAVTGDFTPGKSADFVCLRPPEGSVLAATLSQAESPERQLSVLLTLAGAESVREVRVRGPGGAFVTLDAVNKMDRDSFVAALGWVFEHSPWVAERTWSRQPFASVEVLHRTMADEVAGAGAEEQVALIRAHPDLGTRARMSSASSGEQAGAGLDHLTLEEYEQLHRLNSAYLEKFGFPFIFAVKGSTSQDILSALERRLSNDLAVEHAMALAQIYRIARIRLEETLHA